MFHADQRVKVDLSGMVVQGVAFSKNVREALATIVRQTSADPPVYLVELLFISSAPGSRDVLDPPSGPPTPVVIWRALMAHRIEGWA